MPLNLFSEPAGTAHRREWETMAGMDPEWAVLADPEHKFGQWEAAEFYASGRREFGAVLQRIHDRLPGLELRRALDFGCGLGRVTSAIDAEVDFCLGVDLSWRMLRAARTAVASIRGGSGSFLLADSGSLACLRDGSFDLVYCRYVLQHLPTPEAIGDTLREFLRLLTPEGVLVVQLPSWLPVLVRLQPRRFLYRLLRACGVKRETLYWRLGLHPIRMRSMPRHEVERILRRAGGQVLSVEQSQQRPYGYHDVTYLVGRGRAEATSVSSSR